MLYNTARIQLIAAFLTWKTTIRAARSLGMSHKEYLAIFDELLASAAFHSGLGRAFAHWLTLKSKRDILSRYREVLYAEEKRKLLMDDPMF